MQSENSFEEKRDLKCLHPQKVRPSSTLAAYPGEKVRRGDFIAGRYEVYAVKEGGMGFVYLCYDHDWGEPVAIKAFKGGVWNEGIVAAFTREAEKWIQLDRHPNIVEAERVELVGGLLPRAEGGAQFKM